MRIVSRSVLLASLAVGGTLATSPAQAQDCMLGEVKMFAGNFAPRAYAFAQGQLLPIAQNTPLFSILGTTYCGNGQTTFALPDLRGRAPVGVGTGPGLSPRDLGEVAGTETVTMLLSQMPAHNHALIGTNDPATHARPLNRTLAKVTPTTTLTYAEVVPDAPMNPGSIGVAGGNQPFGILNPYLGINFIICMEGIFPSRN